jgi:hypothetical protein
MDRETLDSLNKETVIRLILSQAEAIERLTREIEALRADNAALRAKTQGRGRGVQDAQGKAARWGAPPA